jgi:hypothetical protein
MSPEERRAYPHRFEQQTRTRPNNPGTRVFNPAARMNHPGSADGPQSLQKFVWDRLPDDGGEPVRLLMDLNVACDAVSRGRGRYCFGEHDDAPPSRADAETLS